MHALRATSVDTTFVEKTPDLGYCIMSYIIAVNGTEIHIWFFSEDKFGRYCIKGPQLWIVFGKKFRVQNNWNNQNTAAKFIAVFPYIIFTKLQCFFLSEQYSIE